MNRLTYKCQHPGDLTGSITQFERGKLGFVGSKWYQASFTDYIYAMKFLFLGGGQVFFCHLSKSSVKRVVTAYSMMMPEANVG